MPVVCSGLDCGLSLPRRRTPGSMVAMTTAPGGRHANGISFDQTDTFQFERGLHARGCALVAGLDEAGRGPLAGPVVAACVILPHDCPYHLFQDSKLLAARRREELFALLHEHAAIIGVGSANPREIEQLNILQASLLAMRRALDNCTVNNGNTPPDHLLVDGKFPAPSTIAQTTLIKGERRSASIAAASIIAKVHRDRLCEELHQRYPQYGFAAHKGYSTAEHLRLLRLHGPCDEHRRSFAPVRLSCRELP